MRRLVSRAAFAVVGLMALTSLAGAQPPCDRYWMHTDDLGGLVYIAWDCFDDGNGACSMYYPITWYIYQETNDEPGLQRGGEGLIIGEDRCRSSDAPDQYIF